MFFANRRECGELLQKHIRKLKLDPKNSVICPIPRGGIAIAEPIYEKEKIPVVPLVIKKIGAPGHEELAIGAASSFSEPLFDEDLISKLGVSETYMSREAIVKKREAKAAERKFKISAKSSDFLGKNVVVVDDGLATGRTATLAAELLRKLGAKQVILAVGCAARETISELEKYDKIICPAVLSDFYAVGQCFRDFSPVSDSEVLAILAKVKSGL